MPLLESLQKPINAFFTCECASHAASSLYVAAQRQPAAQCNEFFQFPEAFCRTRPRAQAIPPCLTHSFSVDLEGVHLWACFANGLLPCKCATISVSLPCRRGAAALWADCARHTH